MRRSFFVLLMVLFAFAALVETGGCAGKPGRVVVAAPSPHRRPKVARRLVEQGIKLLGNKRYPRAGRAFRQALEADALSGAAHNDLGKVEYHEGRLYKAAWHFQHAAELLPHQPEPQNNLGLVLEAAGRLDEAVRHYDRALDMQSDNAEVLGNLVRARVRRGDHGEKIRKLLRELVMKDARPRWRAWARRRLALHAGSHDHAEASDADSAASSGGASADKPEP